MRDAYGGIVNISMIVVFLVLVSGLLAFNVSYTKAFRTKNRIISYFEEYEGNCGSGTECETKIQEYMGQIGYNVSSLSCTNFGMTENVMQGGKMCSCPHNKYCYVETKIASTQDLKEKATFKITTAINIDIPIVNKILPGLKIFQVSGDTKQVVLR